MSEDIVIRLKIDPTTDSQPYAHRNSNEFTTFENTNAENTHRQVLGNRRCPAGLEWNNELSGCVYRRTSSNDTCPDGMRIAANNSAFCVFTPAARCRPGTEFRSIANGCVAEPWRVGPGNRPGWGCGGNRPVPPIWPPSGFCPPGFVFHPRWNACLPAGSVGPGWGGPSWGGGWGSGWGGGWGSGWGSGWGNSWGGNWGNGGWGGCWGNSWRPPSWRGQSEDSVWDE